MRWGIIALLIILLAGLSIGPMMSFLDGDTENRDDILTMDTNPIAEVEHEVIIKFNYPYLKVKVTGEQQRYDLLLYDPDGTLQSTRYIFEDDMLMGHASKDLDMTPAGVHNAPSGDYTLIIRDGSYNNNEIHHQEIISFIGANISITDVDIYGGYYDSLEYGYIGQVDISVNNTGDLPFYFDEFRIHVVGEADTRTLYDTVSQGDESTLAKTVYISDIPVGVHDVVIEIYYDGTLVDSFERTINMQPTNQGTADEETDTGSEDGEVCISTFALIGVFAFTIPMLVSRGK